VANCDAAREALLQAERPRPETVCVLENGVDLDRFAAIAPLSARPGPLDRVGVVANLRHVKGLDVLLDAAARLLRDHPGLSLRIAGAGPEREALARQAAALGVEKAVTFLGSVTDVPAFLAEVDVAVLPSRAEGMSNAVLEYMAAGRAVVATSVGSNARLLGHGAHGLLVPPGDAGALADAVGLLLADRERACELGAAGRRFVEVEFSRAAMVRRFEDFFIGLARRNRERQAA
jgi:glycosyltransferase involved in cell wall biosynthesis